MPGKGLYANIHAKRKRIKAGSGEKMRKPGTKGAPTAKAFKRSAKTASFPGTKRGDNYCARSSGQKKTAKVKARRKAWGCRGKKSVG